MFYRYLLFLLVFALFASPSALANTPPVPVSKKDALKQIESHIANTKEAQTSLKEEQEKAEQDIQTLKKDLVAVSRDIRKNEKHLSDIEERLIDLRAQKDVLEGKLIQDRQAIADLLLALQRLSRVPTESLLARPGAPLQSAQSSIILKQTLPPVQERAAALNKNLEQLQTVRQALAEEQDKALATAQALKEKNSQLAQLVRKRQKYYEQTRKRYSSEQERYKELSQQAASLKDLIKKLDQERAAQKRREEAAARKRAQKRRASARSSYTPPTNLPDIGTAIMPVSGIIKERFGDIDNFGAENRGLKISSRDNAVVLAPMGGLVRFAGFFKNFGQLVILEHKNGYHSLVAGLGRIDVTVGQSVESGEPVGALSGGDKESQTLYYELRYKGKPVDPAVALANLGLDEST